MPLESNPENSSPLESAIIDIMREKISIPEKSAEVANNLSIQHWTGYLTLLIPVVFAAGLGIAWLTTSKLTLKISLVIILIFAVAVIGGMFWVIISSALHEHVTVLRLSLRSLSQDELHVKKLAAYSGRELRLARAACVRGREGYVGRIKILQLRGAASLFTIPSITLIWNTLSAPYLAQSWRVIIFNAVMAAVGIVLATALSLTVLKLREEQHQRVLDLLDEAIAAREKMDESDHNKGSLSDTYLNLIDWIMRRRKQIGET